MNCGRNGIYLTFFLVSLLFFSSACLYANEEFRFEPEEFQKKNLECGGYAELKYEHMDVNQGSVFSWLNLSDKPLSTLDRFFGSLQIDGYYTKKIISLNWVLRASAQQDDIGWTDTSDVYEAYGSIKPAPFFTANIGKKSYMWGKGYAWNPAGFVNRLKDPNDPEEALEGYLTTEVDFIKSFAGPLRTIAFTTLILPVWHEVNEDFGEMNNVNFAAKLYFLYHDTDIDFILYTGESRSTRYGLDFAKNLAPNFEIHGELAYIPHQKSPILQNDGSILTEKYQEFSYLFGLRYLSENDITSIIEYYHNDAGYTEEEMTRFFEFIEDCKNQFFYSSSESFLERARSKSLQGYGRPQSGRNYLYMRFTQKEPFDILYFSPGLISIFNLDDKSYSIIPELVYTGFTNWELRLRFAYLNGGKFTEYGEKMNSNRLELRIRHFF